MMTVQELLSHRRQYPPDTRVVVGGYEGGYNDITILKSIRINPDAHTEWYIGRHDDDESGSPALLSDGESVFLMNIRKKLKEVGYEF